MDIIFKDDRLEECCNNQRLATKKWGPVIGKNVGKRAQDISDAENLGVLMKVPQAGCHPLKHDRAGQWAVKIGPKERLIFELADDCISTTSGGMIDMEKVTRVRILEVVLDYHDPKEKRRPKK